MKKLFLFLLIPFMSQTICAQDGQEIIHVENVKSETDIKARSILPILEATLDYDMQAIEFVFNDQIGTVTITISSMGQVVASAVCNTSYESIRWVSVPMVAGYYDIYISGASYEGTGSYTISSGEFDL